MDYPPPILPRLMDDTPPRGPDRHLEASSPGFVYVSDLLDELRLRLLQVDHLRPQRPRDQAEVGECSVVPHEPVAHPKHSDAKWGHRPRRPELLWWRPAH